MFLAMLAIGLTQPSWTPQRLLDLHSRGDSLPQDLERGLIEWFGGQQQVVGGASVKTDDLVAAWAITVPEGSKGASVRSEPTTAQAKLPPFELTLKQVGSSRLFVGAAQLSEGQAFRWRYHVDGAPLPGNPRELEVYTLPKEARPQPGVTPGKLEQQPRLTSQVFGGTWHDWWIYTPAGFDAQKESNLVLFQDGQWSRHYAPVYFDNLIAQGDLPQTVVVFVTPGTKTREIDDRMREYDTLSDAYSRFVLEELLPPVEARFKITQDPMKRCIAGLSSGGICSFTVAWERPDKFGLVMSWIGSFTNIASGDSKREGGHNYPALIRKTDRKPIRVFLQEGENDLDNVHGNWPLANHAMERALRFKGYELKTVWGNGFHSDKHGRATMADALRWLFGRSNS